MLAMRNIANQEPVVFSYICFPLQDLADNYISSAAITLPFLSFFSFPHSICLIPFLPRQPQLCSSIVRGSGVKTSDWRRKVSDFTSTFFFLFRTQTAAAQSGRAAESKRSTSMNILSEKRKNKVQHHAESLTIFLSQPWDEFLGRDNADFLLLCGDAVEQVSQAGEQGLFTARLHLKRRRRR